MMLSLSGAEFEGDARVETGVDIDLGERWGRRGAVRVGRDVYLSRGVLLHCFGYGGVITIGENVFIGPYTVLYGHGGVTIGRDTLIGMHCRIVSANHALPPRSDLVRTVPDELLPVSIGEDVWIGAGATILGGVRIGRGAVIGAGAVVTRDIADYSIAVGVPARVVGQRE
jgi:acetyltransferase-like isoleucine patch superfamily enzyme